MTRHRKRMLNHPPKLPPPVVRWCVWRRDRDGLNAWYPVTKSAFCPIVVAEALKWAAEHPEEFDRWHSKLYSGCFCPACLGGGTA
jgi:hypothetical protein